MLNSYGTLSRSCSSISCSVFGANGIVPWAVIQGCSITSRRGARICGLGSKSFLSRSRQCGVRGTRYLLCVQLSPRDVWSSSSLRPLLPKWGLLNGSLPTMMPYITTPRLHKSTSVPYWQPRLNNSGAAYSGEPHCVLRSLSPSQMLLRPKSARKTKAHLQTEIVKIC